MKKYIIGVAVFFSIFILTHLLLCWAIWYAGNEVGIIPVVITDMTLSVVSLLCYAAGVDQGSIKV